VLPATAPLLPFAKRLDVIAWPITVMNELLMDDDAIRQADSRWIESLPHRPPMRLLEVVVEVVPGERALARRVAHPGDFYFDGHFPDCPVVPAIILIELVAQTGGIAAAAAEGGICTRQLRVAAIGPFRFPAAAGPGAIMEATARVTGRFGQFCKIDGNVTADGVLVASGTLTLAG
jgi:3-hydroxyacyl-[acyl-carrier-protein] dehydratase